MTTLPDFGTTPIWRLGDVAAHRGQCVVTLGVFDGVHHGHARLSAGLSNSPAPPPVPPSSSHSTPTRPSWSARRATSPL